MTNRGKFFIKLLCLIMAAVLLIAASGCGADPGNSGNSTPAKPAEETPASYNDGDFDKTPYEGLVFSRIYGNSAKKEAATSSGFIELYNSGEKPVDCTGLAVYYKSPSINSYKSYVFKDTVIGAGSFYLIKCAHSDSFDSSSEIISIDSSDDFWNVEINAGEIDLILGPASMPPAPDDLPEEFKNAVSYFRATDSYTFDTGCISALSKNKYAVRVTLTSDSGWETVDLTGSTSAKLRLILPQYSKGTAGAVKRCALNEVDFDHAPGMYGEQFYLTMKAAEGASIYYTEDGTDPRTSDTRKIYKAPLLLEDTSNMKIGQFSRAVYKEMGRSYYPPNGVTRLPGCYAFKACSEKNGEYSEVFSASYFVSPLYKEFNVTVMSVSIDTEEVIGENGFYNHYYGSENISNPRGIGVMEVFDKAGTRTGCANVELSVSGHGSSGAPMKSLKVFYKKSENESGGMEDKLYYDLFEGYSVNEKGQRITDFARLLLRNSGNDYGRTYIRDAYMQRVSRTLKLDTMAYAPALVFFNGCFWGVYNVRERYSGDYVESHHGIDKDNVALIESDYSQVHTNQNAPFVVTSGLDSDADAFNTLMEYIRSRDLSVQKNFDYVAGKLDLDSFIDMYVSRMYFNAVDWPENNIKIWRNRAGEGDPSNYDTKWHFTLLDMDFGVGFYDDLTAYDKTIWGAMYGRHCVVGTIMAQLLGNDAFREKFIYRFYELGSNILTPEYLESELDKIVAEREPFNYLQAKRWGVSDQEYANGIEVIREFVRKRQGIVLSSFLSEMKVDAAAIRSKFNNEACLTFKYAHIEKAYIDGNSIPATYYIPLNDGPVDIVVEFKVRKNYQINSVIYQDYDGNILKSLSPQEIESGTVKLYIDKAVKIIVECRKK